MKLTTEQIKQLTVGALWSQEKEDGLHFYKCTQKQIDAWYALSTVLGERAEATTGIRLDFYTNSKELRFAANKGKFELHINNLLRRRYKIGTEEFPSGAEIVCPLNDPLGNPLEEARVTLYFPSHSCAVLQSVSVNDGAYLRPAEYDCRLLMIGDSITQGWDSTYDSFSYANCLSRSLNANSVIQGIGGAVFHESTLDEIPFDPDIVTVAYGTNDYNKYDSYERLTQHVSRFLDGIREMYGDKRVFVISPIWRGKVGTPMGSFEGCREIIITEAEKRGMIHIDGLAMVPPIPELFSDAWLHPNALGYGFYAENVTREILKHLK